MCTSKTKRLNIGLFICHLDNDYAYDICKGVDFATKELDANLIVFPGMYINAAYNNPQKARFDYQYNSIFYYASPENLDVLIISMGTIGSFLSETDLKSFLEHFKDIPIVTIEIEIPGYSCVYTEGKTGLKKAIEHLIIDHQQEKIGFVSGRPFNADAIERLETYKETLTQYNIPIEDNLIVHGDFSEFCEPLVEQLLDNNPDMHAIIFANDQMASGGYNVFKRRDLKIGQDILVCGYDDAPIALILDPPLTTVKASPSNLGYYAVYQAIDLLNTKIIKTTLLNSDFIPRASCGCHKDIMSPFEFISSSNINLDKSEELSIIITNRLLSEFSCGIIEKELNDVIQKFFKKVISNALDNNIKVFPQNEIMSEISAITSSSIIIYFNIEQLIYLFSSFDKIILAIIPNHEKQLNYCFIINSIFCYLNSLTSSARYNEKKEYKLNIWSSSYITRDSLTYGRDDKACFSLIMDTMTTLPFANTYVYLYDEPISQLSDGSWKTPPYLLLQAYNRAGKTNVLMGGERIISSKHIFTNEYMHIEDRCSTLVLTPIFTNTQHHGIFLCEVDIKNFHHIYSTSLQLGTALKFLSLLKEQISTQNKLVLSLQEIHDKNLQLNKLSVSDELTGLYNRRGFLEIAQSFIKDPLHIGKHAVIVFADMDNLKMVNDKFGHNDGDFALKSIANILKKSFRPEDVIGRLGGDEFVAFALANEEHLTLNIQQNIEFYSDELNKTCGKPYFIDISIGISEFVCGDSIIIEDILSEADSALYSNKKYKKKSILKNI